MRRLTPLRLDAQPNLRWPHLPSYVAFEKGLFRSEGLSVKLVSLTSQALVSAGLNSTVDFVPVEGRGAQVALSGRKLKFVVGQAVISHAVLAVRKEIRTLDDLNKRNVGVGEINGFRPALLRPLIESRFGSRWKLHLEPRELARVKGFKDDVYQGVFVSPRFAAKALQHGHRVLAKIGDTRPYLSGTIWTRTSFVSKNRLNIVKFVRLIACAILLIQRDKNAVVPVIMKYFGIVDPKEAGHVWQLVRTQFAPDIPKALVTQLFRDQLALMKRRGLRKINKAPPNFEAFIARKLLSSTLKRLGYILRPPPYRRKEAS